eukprot:gene11718-86_t
MAADWLTVISLGYQVATRQARFVPSVNIVHFNESDLYVPKSDTPSAFKKRRLRKGTIPSVNLRGREEDERVEKRRKKCTMPESFGDFTNCRVIIDCTEFQIADPRKDLSAASATYSNYKHFLSVKYLIGVAPNGEITFVSRGFPGSTSDKSITDEPGIISHLKVGITE